MKEPEENKRQGRRPTPCDIANRCFRSVFRQLGRVVRLIKHARAQTEHPAACTFVSMFKVVRALLKFVPGVSRVGKLQVLAAKMRGGGIPWRYRGTLAAGRTWMESGRNGYATATSLGHTAT